MSFRRNGKAAKNWTNWKKRHAAVLSQCGLPEILFQDERSWENFLFEGFLPSGCGVWSGWSVAMLSLDQARRFYTFLDRVCAGHPFQQSMMNVLRRHIQQATPGGAQHDPA